MFSLTAFTAAKYDRRHKDVNAPYDGAKPILVSANQDQQSELTKHSAPISALTSIRIHLRNSFDGVYTSYAVLSEKEFAADICKFVCGWVRNHAYAKCPGASKK